MIININIDISEEAYIRLMSGKSVPGQMKKALATGVITFDDWKHKTKKQRAKDKLVHQLEMGWVKESPEKYKVFMSIYKKLGLPRILSIIDREMKEAKTSLFDKELIETI